MKRVNVWKPADEELRESFISSVHAQKPHQNQEQIRKAAKLAYLRRWSISAGRPFPVDRCSKPRSSTLRVTVRTLAVMQLIPLNPKIQHDVIEVAASNCSSTNRVMCALG